MLKIINLSISLICILLISTGCGIHRFDQDQVPVISISGGQYPVISWVPPNAYQISIYKGIKAGDGSIGEIWNKGRNTGYQNKLNSPVISNATLESGETYTIAIQRKDIKGKGNGFSNTRHRYVGTKTFMAQ